MAPLFIIDGYNLLHAAGLARASYGPGDLEQCRQRLLGLVASGLSPKQRTRTIVVFDAKDPAIPDSPPSEQQGMLVWFAEGSGDADEVIERLIAAHTAPRRLCVVSGDRRLQRAARRRRAQFVDSEAFLRQLLISRRRTEPPPQDPCPKQSGVVTPAELTYWLREFSDVDPQQVKDEFNGLPPATQAPMGADHDLRGSGRHCPGNCVGRDELEDELAFWEQRLEELLDNEPRADD